MSSKVVLGTGSGDASPARVCAMRVVRRVFEHGAYADRALTGEAVGLDARERALAMQIAYGTVQRRATLDHVIARLTSRPLGRLDAPVLAVLRIGVFQLLFLDNVAQHAAVDESVKLIKSSRPQATGMVNAVLRRTAGEGPEIIEELDEKTPRSAAIMHSAPDWLARRWWEELGAEEARGLLRQANRPAESALRANTLVATTKEVLAELPVPAHGGAEVPEAIVPEAPFDAHGSALFARGAIMPQSRASMLVGHVLRPHHGERVLDLCAAPGAKTTHLAALMDDRGALVAVERHPGRAAALKRTATRMRATSVRVRVGDAAVPCPEAFDRVLVDPPCSGLGTLQSRPDLRWRTSPAQVARLAGLQASILGAGAAATAPGGVLVYSVCTISRAEGLDLIAGFLRARPDFALDDLGSQHPRLADAHEPRCLQLLPHRDGTDGFFIARLRRSRPAASLP